MVQLQQPRNLKYDAFAFLLICVTVFFAWRYLQREGFAVDDSALSWFKSAANGTFMSAQDTRAFLMEDQDYYTHSFTEWDVIARRAMIEPDYRRTAASAALDFSPDQRERLSAASKRADAFFASCGLGLEPIHDIPWVFAMTRGKAYEDGMPHTRAGVIFLSTEVDETPLRLYKLLVHEKIHVYQRLYPERTQQYLSTQGFRRWKHRAGTPRIRANPDLDPWIYINTTTDQPMLAVYTSDKPANLNDVIIKYGEKYEHPYEQMAYTIANKAVASAAAPSAAHAAAPAPAPALALSM